MCKLRRSLARSWRWYLLGFGLLFFVVFLDLWREEARAGVLVLESRTDPEKPQPRIQVELFSDDPATEYHEASVLRRLYSGTRELFVKPEGRFISAHHYLEKVRALRLIETHWIEPGERWEIRLQPGKYVLARELFWGREGFYAHSGMQYYSIEIKPNERAEYVLQELDFRR